MVRGVDREDAEAQINALISSKCTVVVLRGY